MPSIAHNIIATPQRVQSAIARASAQTGVDFDFLLSKARVESSLNPNARAKTSSATGLYQFTQQTWLEMIRDHGGKYGLGKYASCIDDNCQVTNKKMRADILALRDDPETSALMAAAYAQENAARLTTRLDHPRNIGQTELYLAHFMGAGGAAKFLNAAAENPHHIAAKLFPAEARANRNVFYDRSNGRAFTLNEIYTHFADKMGADPASLVIPERPQALSGISRHHAAPTSLDTVYTPEQRVPITRAIVDALLAAPVTKITPAPAAPAPTALAAVQDTLHQMQQSQLMVLAQTYLHADNARYNG